LPLSPGLQQQQQQQQQILLSPTSQQQLAVPHLANNLGAPSLGTSQNSVTNDSHNNNILATPDAQRRTLVYLRQQQQHPMTPVDNGGGSTLTNLLAQASQRRALQWQSSQHFMQSPSSQQNQHLPQSSFLSSPSSLTHHRSLLNQSLLNNNHASFPNAALLQQHQPPMGTSLGGLQLLQQQQQYLNQGISNHHLPGRLEPTMQQPEPPKASLSVCVVTKNAFSSVDNKTKTAADLYITNDTTVINDNKTVLAGSAFYLKGQAQPSSPTVTVHGICIGICTHVSNPHVWQTLVKDCGAQIVVVVINNNNDATTPYMEAYCRVRALDHQVPVVYVTDTQAQWYSANGKRRTDENWVQGSIEQKVAAI